MCDDSSSTNSETERSETNSSSNQFGSSQAPLSPHASSVDITTTSSSHDPRAPRLRCPMKRVRHAKVEAVDYDRTCTICGSKAINYNYGVICCESCKMFFRRNSWKMESMRCVQNKLGKCSMNASVRRKCSACRLKKCLDKGMLRQLNSFDQQARLQVSCPPIEKSPEAAPSSSEMPKTSKPKVEPQASCSTSPEIKPVPTMKTEPHEDTRPQPSSSISLLDLFPRIPSPDPAENVVLRCPSPPGSNPLAHLKPSPWPLDRMMEQFELHQAQDSAIQLERDAFYQALVSLVEPIDPVSNPVHMLVPTTCLNMKEFQEVAEVEHAALEFLREPHHSSVGDYLEAPSWDTLVAVSEECARSAILFARLVPAFSSLCLDDKKQLIITRLQALQAHLALLKFDHCTNSVRLLLNDGTEREYNSMHHLQSALPEDLGGLLGRHCEMIATVAKVLGPSRRHHALFCCMKLFELSPSQESHFGPELFNFCLTAFSKYATMLKKSMHAEIPVGFEERWRSFCHVYCWTRYEFDVALVSGMRHVLENPGACKLMMEVAKALQDLLI